MTSSLRIWQYTLASLLILSVSPLSAASSRLLREPDLVGQTLVFTYAQDIWKTSLQGGTAQRLTSFQGQESAPKISPDGKWVAFTGEYAGNKDVYITPSNGGEPRRLTFHPGADTVRGWSSDGKAILFSSGRSNAPRGQSQLFTISADGGMPTALPMNRAMDGAFSPDGKRLVYRQADLWDGGWRNYRGGQNQPLRLITLSDLSESDLPWDNSLDLMPVWHGDDIYFLSNAGGVANVVKYSLDSKTITAVTKSEAYDINSFSLNNTDLVYEYMGDLYHMNASGKVRQIAISIKADFAWAMPHWEDVSKQVESGNLSPTAKRAVFVARGDVFTVPMEQGDVRNLTNSSDSREVAAAWSNDGQRIAWFSDKSGEYQIQIADQKGQVLKEIKLAGTGYYDNLTWSPDDKRLMFTDQKQQLWLANTENLSTKIIDQNSTIDPVWYMQASWSPDSNFVAYTKQDATFFRSIYIYSITDGKSFRVTNGLADARHPAWDAEGKRLYFAASINFGPKAAWLDMTSIGFTPEYELYYALLNTEATSPFGLKSDEEELTKKESSDDKDDDSDNKSADKIVSVQFAGISSRIFPISGVKATITDVTTGKEGQLFYAVSEKGKTSLYRYDINERKASEIASDLSQFSSDEDAYKTFDLSHDGKKILIKSASNWRVFDATGKLDEKALTLKMNLSKWVDNQAEWQQIFREAWRFQRDYFYVDNIHGADWDQVYKDYRPLVEHVRHAADMTYLLDLVGAETSIGHSFTANGDLPDVPSAKTGLLGIDISSSNKGFVIERIYDGEEWYSSEQLAAPLALHQQQLNEGDTIVSVNGKPLKPGQNFYQAFIGTVGVQTDISIKKKTGEQLTITVVPIRSDINLRRNAWVEDNRKRVQEATDGKIAYVWVPNTADQGYNYFNRYFFAQSKHQGVIIDERFNHGGYIAEYIIDVLRREQNGYFNNNYDHRRQMTSPGTGIWGPKVMLINEMSGSGGDMLPHMFKFYKLGPLIGKRTWGGLVGIWGVPSLVDGGYITAPRSGYFNNEGQWQVENEGVPADIEVEQWTRDMVKGIDPQLEKAIQLAKDSLKIQAVKQLSQPEPPVRVPNAK